MDVPEKSGTLLLLPMREAVVAPGAMSGAGSQRRKWTDFFSPRCRLRAHRFHALFKGVVTFWPFTKYKRVFPVKNNRSY